MEPMTTSQEQKAEDACWGYQLIIDCFGCSEEVCCDLDHGYEFLDQICAHLQMTKQTQPYIFKTCDRTFPGRPGYSGWVPIIESGIQIHTSANNRFVSVDVYSCKKFDARGVEAYVRGWFQPKATQVQFFHRGDDLLKRSFPERLDARIEEPSLVQAG
jgi:S-adenosylmethionine decarboxylase